MTATWRRWLGTPVVIGFLVLAVGAFLGWAARYWLIEPEDLYKVCLGAGKPWWCGVRETLITVTFTLVRGIYGWVAVACGVSAWLLRGRVVWFFVLLALFTGGMGLYLYAAAGAAFGLLLALLRLVRLDEISAQPPEFPY